MESKVCCMFQEKDADLAVYHRSLERLANYWDSSRRQEELYRCRKCGALVYYSYEEIANLYGGWDNADIFEYYYPVVREISDPEDWEEVKRARTFQHHIYGHNMEEDALSSRSYYYTDH